MNTYVLKYNFINDDKSTSLKLYRFAGIHNLLGFVINISCFCVKDSKMTVYDKATKEKLIEGTPHEILKFFKPEASDKEIRNYVQQNLREHTIQHIRNNSL